MRICTHEQGSDQWLADRLGILSASRMGPLMTGGGAQSKAKGAETLVIELVWETLLGCVLDEGSGEWTDGGNKYEPWARAWLAYKLDTDIQQVGFCIADDLGEPLDGRVGYSPDGLVGEDALAELKCPSPKWHLKYLLHPELLEAQYAYQVQAGLLVSGRSECHLVSFLPGERACDPPTLPTVHRIVWPDKEYQEELRKALTWAVERIDEAVASIREMQESGDDNPFA